MSDSIEKIAGEIMQQVLYGATVDWRPNMAQIAQRLRKIDSLRQVPDGLKRDHYLAAWEAARSLQHIAGMAHVGKAWKDMAASAAHGVYAVFGEAVDADWHSRTPWLNPAPPTSSQGNVQPESLTSGTVKESEATPAQAGAVALVEAFEDAVIRRMRAYNPDDPMPKDGGSIREELAARNALLTAIGAQAVAELPEFFGPDDAGCYYVKTNRGWFYARPQKMLTPEQLAELARRGGSDG